MSVPTAPPAARRGAPTVREATAPVAVARALFARGLRDNKRAPLTWGLPLGFFCGLIVAMWPSIEDSIGKAIQDYPEALKEAFNIQTLDTAEKYLDIEMFSLVVPLAVAFFAVRAAIRSLVAAEDHGYLDTLLAAPVSRRVLAGASFVVTAGAVALVLAVIAALILLAGLVFGVHLSTGHVIAGVANVWPLSMFFAGLAVLLSGVMHRAAPVTAVAAGTLGAMYIVDFLGKVADAVEPLRYASAFRYYGSAMQNGIDVASFAGLTVTAILLAAAGAFLFERRDVL